jgi:predicted nucleic acid-binding protein
MTDVFVDTNVLLDVLAKREPFHDEALEIWTLCEEGTLHGFISVISFKNIFYLVRKFKNATDAYGMLDTLRRVFTPVTLDAQIIHQSLGAGFTDFEDAIQFHSALRADAQCLITRNPNHFPKSGLIVLTPKEFLAARAAQ